MTGTLAELFLAGMVLLATHYGISSTGLRPLMVETIGAGPYRGLYSLVAVAAFVWLIVAYNAAPPGAILWDLGAVGAHAPVLLMPIALFLLICGISAPNPTSAGQEKRLEDPEPAVGVLRITRNPVLWGIGLWAVAHLAANGDTASVVLFGTLAVLALFGTLLLDARQRRDRGALFAPFELSPSPLPMLAVFPGRQSLGPALREIGWIRLAATVLAYGALLHFHGWIFGVPAILI
ncbi:MAG: NnrU family protein [Inquilinus sp.]|nr:NnrU family protein [Inquilinus sp.]